MLLNKKINCGVLLTMSFFLFACGGGGEQAALQSNVPTEVVHSSVSTEMTAQADNTALAEVNGSALLVKGAADINVPAGFDFATAYQLNFSVSLAQRSAERVFITLCPEYIQSGATYAVDYDSCILKVSVSDGFFADTLSLTNDKQTLLAVLWFFDGSEPAYFTWNKDNSAHAVQQFSIEQ